MEYIPILMIQFTVIHGIIPGQSTLYYICHQCPTECLYVQSLAYKILPDKLGHCHVYMTSKYRLSLNLIEFCSYKY